MEKGLREIIKRILNLDFSRAKELVLVFLFLTLFFNLKAIKPDISKGLKPINPTASQLFLTKEEKFCLRIGGFICSYVEFIKQQTPEDAIILVPPQGFPWPMTGNVAYFRYFLYPRYLVNGGEKKAKIDLKEEGIEYVLLAWGETEGTEYDYTHGWPKFSLPAKRIIYKKDLKDQYNYEGRVVEKDYDPLDPVNFENWGLIELDRERL